MNFLLFFWLCVAIVTPASLAAANAVLCGPGFANVARIAQLSAGEQKLTAIYAQINQLAEKNLPHVKVSILGYSDGFPIHQINVGSGEPDVLKIFLSSGVHGDEPDGISAMMNLLQEVVSKPELHGGTKFTFVPMINPGGLSRLQRNNLANLDINRSFLGNRWSEASAAIRDGLGQDKFDLSVDLHGAALKRQFFLIRERDDGGLGQRVMGKIPPHMLLPSTTGKYPGFAPAFRDPQRYLLDSPGTAVSSNKGTLKSFMSTRGTLHSYTLEYPGRMPPPVRQAWTNKILRTLLDEIRNEAKPALNP